MNDDRRFGQRAGIRWAIAWLHKRAGEMSDPHTKTILNTAAFNMGTAAKDLQIVEHPTEEDHDRT